MQTIATAPGTRSGNRSGAAVSISRRDGCTGKLLFLGSAGGSDFPVTFSWDPRLTAAELHGTATILNVAPGAPAVPVPIRVDIAWTGAGELERGNSHYRYEDKGVLVTLHDNGALRFATVAGTVTDGATQFISGGTSVLGWIAWSNYGQVVYSPPGR